MSQVNQLRTVDYGKTCPTLLGNGVVVQTGQQAKELGMSKIMIVTDASIVKTGIVARIEKSLKEAGLQYSIFDKIMPDPLDSIVDEGGELAKKEKFDGVIGVGGGSCMDAAKGISIIATNPAPIVDYFRRWDYKRHLPLILIPTTTGTGSENTKFSVLTISKTGMKEVVFCVADLALCDPELTYGLPPQLTATTGMDAFAHAAEAITVKNPNLMTNILAVEAIKRIAKYLPIAYNDPTNAEARFHMMVGSNLAGLAISNTGCHIGHACSEAMGATFHVPHGISCAWGLPEAMAYAAKDRFEEVKIVADALGVDYGPGDPPAVVGKKVADDMRAFMKSMNIPSIKDQGIKREELLGCADFVLENLNFLNLPTPMTRAEVESFLASLYDAYQ